MIEESMVEYTYTKQHMDKKAFEFINEVYGLVGESDDKEQWYTRLGMLLHFVALNYPK
jgi:hypothetical protein